jgi:hypothetical protein
MRLRRDYPHLTFYSSSGWVYAKEWEQGCALLPLIQLTWSPMQRGLEGLQPSKNHLFLVVCAGFAGTYH